MIKIFSPRTLGEFEAAAASIPLRPLDRAFDGVGIRLGKDPGGPDGARRVQFRRYVASVDQHDPQQLDRLGVALGALIEEVAESKQGFLMTAAERDGFVFANGVFQPASTAPSSFGVTRLEEFAFIEERGRRLQLLANDNPKDTVSGAKELAESVCRTVLHLMGKPAPGKAADLADIAKSTLKALEGDTKMSAAVMSKCVQQLAAVVATLRELRNLSPRHARLAAGAAVTFAGFVAETYLESANRQPGKPTRTYAP
jgi:hypothetical protein